MNYKNVNKKNKNKLITIVSLVLAVVVAGGAIAGIGYATDWFKNPDKIENVVDFNDKKPVPSSTYNLEIDTLDDLVGLKFTEDKWSWIYRFDADNNVVEENSEAEVAYSHYGCILDVATYGDMFSMPIDGLYKFVFKVNDRECILENIPVTYDCVEFGNYFLAEENGENTEYLNLFISNGLVLDPTNLKELDLFNGEGYTLQVQAVGFELETFELVSFERTGDFPVEDNTDGENA